MRRPKTRVQILAEALTAAQQSADLLAEIDLRKCKEPLRSHIKTARATSQQTAEACRTALMADTPVLPTQSPPAKAAV